jgi:septum formation protein
MLKPLYLASQSPRRQELLRQIGLAPAVLLLRTAAGRADVDETPLPDESAIDYVMRLARLKAETGERARDRRVLADWPIVAADTTVTVDGQILGKPANVEEAAAMLRAYSGRSHTVLTGVAVVFHGRTLTALSESTVRFRPLTEAEIAAFVATREPFDKAGGYGIQGRAAMFIEQLVGSYSGVMGLPLYETAQLLREVGFEPI